MSLLRRRKGRTGSLKIQFFERRKYDVLLRRKLHKVLLRVVGCRWSTGSGTFEEACRSKKGDPMGRPLSDPTP